MCASIPSLQTRTRLSLIVHAKELKRTTNTGRLAIKALINSEMYIRGLSPIPLDLSSLIKPEYQPFLFFPSEDAIELTSGFASLDPRPIQLIVPDGNWRQASKVPGRYPQLKDIPRVKIAQKNISTAHLRKEHKPEGMSTLEAIASAYSIIESSSVGQQLQDLYLIKLHRTLMGRPG